MLKLFKVFEHGETHYIAGESQEEMLRLALRMYDIDEDGIEGITEVGNNEVLRVHIDPTDTAALPKPPEQDWHVTATVAEWLAVTDNGGMVCSTVF